MNATTAPPKTTLPSPFAIYILGASRGIGASIAHAYALESASTIILVSRTFSALEAVAVETRASTPSTVVMTVNCDITSPEDVAALAEQVKGEVGAYYAAHFLVPVLLSTAGGARAFVAVSSLGAWMVGGDVAHTVVCMSELAQVRLVEMLAEELRERELLAVAVHLGFVVTEISEVVAEEWRKNGFYACYRALLNSNLGLGHDELLWPTFTFLRTDLTDEPGLCGAMCV